MYLTLKDHKPGDKSRGIVTGCSSNTRGMSNSVSDVLEAVANNEKEPYEVCSGEDMLARIHACNEKTMARRNEWMERRFMKIETICDMCEEQAALTSGCTTHSQQLRTDTRLWLQVQSWEDKKSSHHGQIDCEGGRDQVGGEGEHEQVGSEGGRVRGQVGREGEIIKDC